MKNFKEQLTKITAVAVDGFINVDLYEWPPGCCGIIAQPMRPKAIVETDEEEN